MSVPKITTVQRGDEWVAKLWGRPSGPLTRRGPTRKEAIANIVVSMFSVISWYSLAAEVAERAMGEED
jgi:hypothetical protein